MKCNSFIRRNALRLYMARFDPLWVRGAVVVVVVVVCRDAMHRVSTHGAP